MASSYLYSEPFNVTGMSRSPWGINLPPSAMVAAYVRSAGHQNIEHVDIKNKLVTTLNAGLAKARSGRGDYVVVFPDHTENISSADQMSSLVAGTKIVGLGTGNLRPTFTWTTATSSFLFDVANVSLDNCILKLCDTGNAGVTVAAPITVSAAGCSITNCRIMFGGDADDIITRGIVTTAAADYFTFSNNNCYGAVAAEVEETFLEFVGADYLDMRDNYIDGATDAVAVGVVRFITTASTYIRMERNTIINRKALSEQAVTGMAGCTGIVKDCHFSILDDTNTDGFEGEGDLSFSGCTCSNLAGEAGTAKTPISA